jgi:hypothetical protein
MSPPARPRTISAMITEEPACQMMGPGTCPRQRGLKQCRGLNAAAPSRLTARCLILIWVGYSDPAPAPCRATCCRHRHLLRRARARSRCSAANRAGRGSGLARGAWGAPAEDRQALCANSSFLPNCPNKRGPSGLGSIARRLTPVGGWLTAWRPENQVRTRLTAGGRRIRTAGPAPAKGSAAGRPPGRRHENRNQFTSGPRPG